MTVASPESLSQVAQYIAASNSEQATVNAQRLEEWKARYPHDVVPVPETDGTNGWPPTCRTENGYVLRTYPANNVTKIKRAGR